jgi:hypothetical protein
MKKIVLVFVIALVYVWSFAETVSYTRYQSGVTPVYENLDWSGASLATVSIPQFDSSLGTLTRVDLTIQYDINQDLYVENLNVEASNVRVRGLCLAIWSNLPNGIPDEEYNTRTNNTYYDYDGYDGLVDYAGPSGRTFEDQTDGDFSDFSFTSSLTSFIGTGTIDMNVDTESEYSVSSGGNVDVVLLSKALATATVTYTYDPITLPVELASFTAITTVDNFAQINWATHSETGLLGFNIYRNETDNLNSSVKINLNPINPTNGSEYQSYSYIDEEIEENTRYYYWLESQELSNISEIHGPAIVTIGSIGQDVEDIVYEKVAGIKSIYPNPFNPHTKIRFYLQSDSNVKFEVYNIIGQRIHSSSLGSKAGEQYHSVTWNGRNDDNRECSSGTYFFRIISNDFTQTTKAVLSK